MRVRVVAARILRLARLPAAQRVRCLAGVDCAVVLERGHVRPERDIETAMERHADTVWRVCMLHFSERQDAQDAFQNTFLKYALADEVRFNGEEHRKAWLIRTASNACRDMLRSAARRRTTPDAAGKLEELRAADASEQPGSALSDVADAMRSLSDPPRTPLYLSLYEGYTAPEIARMVDAPVNTVYTWISRGKAALRERLQ